MSWRKMLRPFVPRRFRSQAIADRWIARATDSTIAAGPFRGMKYINDPAAPSLPKLLGSYELQLQGVIAELRDRAYPVVVNVGAAEGYYAVGLARAHRATRVIAFEMDEDRRRLLEAIAELNGVRDQIEIAGACGLPDLTAVLDAQTSGNADCLLLMDVEGAEQELLDPVSVPALRRCTILVELHPYAAPGVDRAIEERFAASHVIDVVVEEPREPADFPPLHVPWYMKRLFAEALVNAMNERRPERMRWFLMSPSNTETAPSLEGAPRSRKDPAP